jgi:DNA-binding Lrp family transcriptional regulator
LICFHWHPQGLYPIRIYSAGSKKKLKISKTDLKLMAELQKDGGTPYSDLAVKLGITPKTVAKRVEGLIKSGGIVIRGQPNPYKLGLSASAVIAIKADPTKIGAICEKLSGYFNVNLVQTVFGRFDILIIVYFPNWGLLHQFINDELYAIDGVTQVELYFIKDVFKRYDRFFEKEPFAKDRLKLKEADWTLIKELAKDGRANPADMAEKLGIHVTTVYRRISALVQRNVIKISGVPNPSRLAFSANAYIILNVDPDDVDNICTNLYSSPEVHFILTLSKRSGMILCVHTRNNETLDEFLNQRISPLKGLINTETFLRASVEKTYYGWLMETDDREEVRYNRSAEAYGPNHRYAR